MSAHVGHAIQKIMQNVPVSVSVSNNLSLVVTNGAGAMQSGLVNGRVQSAFREMPLSAAVGTIVDAQATETACYVLNSSGSVFAAYCNGGISEVYIPTSCDGYAKKLAAGRDHCLIWTDKNKVFGVGCNGEYQLVPQGQCRYDYATEIQISDYLTHNNSLSTSFAGTIKEVNTPVTNPGTVTCGKAQYIKQDSQQVYLGNLLQVTNVDLTTTNVVNAPRTNGTLLLPLYADVRYYGFVGVDSNGVANGRVDYETTGIYTYVPRNSIDSTGTFQPAVGASFEVNNNVGDIVYLTNGSSFGSANIGGFCGTELMIPLDTTLRGTLTVATATSGPVTPDPNSTQQSVLVLSLNASATDALGVTTVSLINGNYYTGTGGSTATIIGTPSFPVNLECCTGCCEPTQNTLPQKCWKNIFAGSDISALLDDCNSLYVLGTIHQVRDNSYLLNNGCLQNIVNQAYATITFPASDINCNTGSSCNGCNTSNNTFSEDFLRRVGVQLSFDPNSGSNVCDVVQSIQNCNQVGNCEDTCNSCDNTVYMDVNALGTNPVDTAPLTTVSQVLVYNRRSLSKAVSYFSSNNLVVNNQVFYDVSIDSSSVLDFNANRYCLDGTDFTVERILRLNTTNVGGSTVVLYVDIDTPGGVRFMVPSERTNNVRFVGNSSVASSNVMNYGSALDPVILTNLKTVVSTLTTPYSNRQYRNPPVSRLYSTYLKGGDCICFSANTGNTRLNQSVTADLPTLFRLNRSILQVGVGHNFLSVLSGSLQCPSEVLALGVNCNGQLGLGNKQNTLTWKAVNKCYFPCPVVNLSCGKTSTFYVLQNGCVWASGYWRCLVDSVVPKQVVDILQKWRIRAVVVGTNTLLLLSYDGCVYGAGNNNLGELGTGNTGFVPKPVPLTCVPMGSVARQVSSAMRHPVERRITEACCDSCASSNECCTPHKEPVLYTRRATTMQSAKYIPNGRVSMMQRYNK